MTPFLRRPLFALALVPLGLTVPHSVLAQTDGQSADAGAYLAARSAAVNNAYRDGAYWFERALAADPEYLPALLGRAEALAVEGRVDEAQRTLSRLMERNPIAGEVLLLAGALEAQYGNFEAAARAFVRPLLAARPAMRIPRIPAQVAGSRP